MKVQVRCWVHLLGCTWHQVGVTGASIKMYTAVKRHHSGVHVGELHGILRGIGQPMDIHCIYLLHVYECNNVWFIYNFTVIWSYVHLGDQCKILTKNKYCLHNQLHPPTQGCDPAWTQWPSRDDCQCAGMNSFHYPYLKYVHCNLGWNTDSLPYWLLDLCHQGALSPEFPIRNAPGQE